MLKVKDLCDRLLRRKKGQEMKVVEKPQRAIAQRETAKRILRGNGGYMWEARPVVLYNDKGNSTYYPSISDASRQTGVPKVSIAKALRGITAKGKMRQAYGFYWKYADEQHRD